MTTVQLCSDFTDYYDHWFPSPHEIYQHKSSDVKQFKRYARPIDNQCALSKRQQFDLLQRIGCNTPRHGKVSELYDLAISKINQGITLNSMCVVYTDEFAHCGIGKMLLSIDIASSEFSEYYASMFVRTEETRNFSYSYRLLQIGKRAWWLSYSNTGDWRSNYGSNVAIEVRGEADSFWGNNPYTNPRLHQLKQYPLFAIDFVIPHWYTPALGKPVPRLAIGFNTAPGIKGTGLEALVSSKQAFELIKEWMEIYQPIIE